ncbi:hypothetical protein [Streptomyces sp. B6B3]|uniref:DUF6895 family protein n=1 Tax=Streptomyces sp. B6B3 TaxID=3153570 RepID=UPI00325DA2D3
MTEPHVPHLIATRALDWLDQHRERFRPRLGPTPDLQVKERLKPLGELAVTSRILLREGVAGSRTARRTRALLDFAWQEALDGGDLLVWMCADEPFSPIPLEVYALFHEVGYRHPGVERHARLVCRTTSWQAVEAVPNRRLGLTRTEARLGLPAGMDTAVAAGRTWLGQLPEPWTAEYHHAYAITHTVFHLTDWGENLAALPEDIADYLARWLPAWIDEWAELQHWDLLGELLVVDACLPDPALDPAVWARYAAAQGPDGAMPVDHTVPTGDPDDVFDLVHHSTMVAVLASTMATSRVLTALSHATP